MSMKSVAQIRTAISDGEAQLFAFSQGLRVNSTTISEAADRQEKARRAEQMATDDLNEAMLKNDSLSRQRDQVETAVNKLKTDFEAAKTKATKASPANNPRTTTVIKAPKKRNRLPSDDSFVVPDEKSDSDQDDPVSDEALSSDAEAQTRQTRKIRKGPCLDHFANEDIRNYFAEDDRERRKRARMVR